MPHVKTIFSYGRPIKPKTLADAKYEIMKSAPPGSFIRTLSHANFDIDIFLEEKEDEDE